MKPSNGLSAITLLGLVFITLKLAGVGAVATWSWWWVTAPFWAGFALVLLIFLTAFVYGSWYDARRCRQRRRNPWLR